jgi:mono/diheme cytochrome c family protein
MFQCKPRSSFFLLLCFLQTACFKQMANQARNEPQGESHFFADKRVERPQVPGTVPTTDDIEPSQPLTLEDLKRGQQRYAIYCTPCHDRVGNGEGLIVLKGFKKPLPFDDVQTLKESEQDIFNAITNGYKSMAGYKNLIPLKDRRRIAAYVRVLQIHHHVAAQDLNSNDKKALEAQP